MVSAHCLYIDHRHTREYIYPRSNAGRPRGPLHSRSVPSTASARKIRRHEPYPPPSFPTLILSFAPRPLPSFAVRGHKRHALQSVLVLHLRQDTAAPGTLDGLACTATTTTTAKRLLPEENSYDFVMIVFIETFGK
ncbi:uncharacterized protein LOC122263969 [Penaeus japonicus]|uniref:uncharacterized protein LOC122263969 n=1 Tax=Penaeus japonicus TaxID=27405 RepID=UPI001C70B067|nr:uncharacterized protein LOC122263969 [Penaeus japonicus]